MLLAAAVAWVLTGPAPALGRLAGREGSRPGRLTALPEPEGARPAGPDLPSGAGTR